MVVSTAAYAARHALIIGNSQYDLLPDLENPSHDTAAYAEAFRSLGYEATLVADQDLASMWQSIDTFLASIEADDEVVFVYSGHGWSDGKVNYLIPTDAPDKGNSKIFARASIPLQNGLNGVLDEIKAAGARLTVAVVDACRNNPFSAKPGTRSAGLARGLVAMEVPSGTFVIYSAGTQQEALDGLPTDPPEQKLSVFTRTFLPLLTSGAYLEDAISDAQVETARLALTYEGHLQHPAYYDQTLGKTCLMESCGQTPVQLVAIQPQAKPAAPDPAPDVEADQTGAAVAEADQNAGADPVAATSPDLLAAMARSQQVADCDALGQHPWHPDIRSGAAHAHGVAWAEMDGAAAETACRAALEAFPEQPRLLAALGRSQQKQSKFDEAMATYLRAADLGDPVAARYVGILYDAGQGVAKDPERAATWYRKAAEAGHAPAQFSMGTLHEAGRGVARSGAEATAWYRKAARQGYAPAQSRLGWLLRAGAGVPVDPNEALMWFRRAARQGDASAQYGMGVMFDKGEGVPENDTEAARWYKLAARQGNPWAQNDLGVMYDTGDAVPRDRTKALRWYRAAADQGLAAAQKNLGRRYEYGVGVAKNLLEAARLYALSAAQGDSGAQRFLDLMTSDRHAARVLEQSLRDAGLYYGAVSGSFGPGARAALETYCRCKLRS